MVMKPVWEARKKIIGIAAIVLLMFFMMNLNSRLTEYFRLSGERDVLRTKVSYDLSTVMAMETRVAYATSDQAVDDWARNDAHMARPGDKFVVPVTPAGQQSLPEIKATPTQRSVENWEVWWALFFGD